MLEHLSDSSRAHFDAVTGYLQDMGIEYTINPRMVRGLDYYTKTCFEFVHDGLGAQSGIGGGGRYDGLMAQLGGQELSGIGFGLGVDRTLLALEAESKSAATGRRVDVYGVALGAEAKQKMVSVVNQLRGAGVAVDMSYGDRGLKGAMKGADRAGALFALVLGESELASDTIVVRDLAAHEQNEISLSTVVDHIVEAVGQKR